MLRTVIAAVLALVAIAFVAAPPASEAQQAPPSKSKAKSASLQGPSTSKSTTPSASGAVDWRTNAFGGPGSNRGS